MPRRKANDAERPKLTRDAGQPVAAQPMNQMKTPPRKSERRPGGVAVQRMVRPRTITLSEHVRQESPVGFMVFAHNDMDADYMIFPDYHEAQTYALEQEERANAPDDSWPIYALWASEWPNAGTHTPRNEKL